MVSHQLKAGSKGRAGGCVEWQPPRATDRKTESHETPWRHGTGRNVHVLPGPSGLCCAAPEEKEASGETKATHHPAGSVCLGLTHGALFLRNNPFG